MTMAMCLVLTIATMSAPARASVNPACTPTSTVAGTTIYWAFTSSTQCEWTVPTGVSSIDYLVVGGGGGGATRHAGGGGAGGLLQGTSLLTDVTSLLMSVGAGGAGGDTAVSGVNYAQGADGSASSMTQGGGTGSFTTVTAQGGGGGATTGDTTGGSGGSGGGALATGGSGSSGQGNNGGSGYIVSGTFWAGGGGGGAGAAGADATSSGAGNGGDGATWTGSGFTTAIATALGLANTTNTYFAGGGGGGATSLAGGSGGLGGGGNGTASGDNAGAGVANTGGGGGGGGLGGIVPKGGDGGSGVILIRYSLPACAPASDTSTVPTQTRLSFTSVTSCGWVVPDGVTALDVLVVGGGGGGSYGTPAGTGGAGGGGDVVLCQAATVVPGHLLQVTLGDGGAGGTVSFDGSQGDASEVVDVTTGGALPCRAEGGFGGTSGGIGGHSGSATVGGGGLPFGDPVVAGGGGGGAGGDATSGTLDAINDLCYGGDGGDGIQVSTVATGLFTDKTDSFGGGGSGGAYGCGLGTAGQAVDGGGAGEDSSYFSDDGVPNTGGGGGGGAYDEGCCGASGGSGFVELRYEISTEAVTTTTTQVSATQITFGDTISDTATVDNNGDAADPTGDVTFYYCYSADSAPTSCDSEIGTQIGDPLPLDVGDVSDDGTSTVSLSDWTPASGAGYYMFFASYFGDTDNLSSYDNGVNESFRVVKKTITVTPTGSTITAGDTASYPFTYSDDFISPDTSASLDTAPTCGSDYTSAAGTYPITCSGGDDHDYDFSYGSATLTVNSLKPSTVYTGETFDSDGGSTSTLSAQISIPTCGGSVVFTVYDLDGAVVVTDTGTVNTSTGVASVTLPLAYGIYTVTAAYTGTDQCDASSDDSVISVINPNDPNSATVGGGYYRKTGFSPPRSNFGFAVQRVLSGRTLTGYKGQLLWMNGKSWRLKATLKASDTTVFGALTCPVRDSSGRALPAGAKCVAFKGSGYLQKWNSVVGGWRTATQYGSSGLVTFTVTVYDGGKASVCKTSGKIRTCTSADQEDWFGIQIDPVAATVLPETVPMSLRMPGNNGAVQIK